MSGPEIIESLRASGHSEVEVFVKRGRSRTARFDPGGTSSQLSEEEGWAVRAGSKSGSFFASGTGVPPVDGPWPAPSPGRLELPASRPLDWRPSPEVEGPMLGESEAASMLRSVAESLATELEGAKLLEGVLHDGSAEVSINNSHGVTVGYRNRVAVVRLWARLGDHQARVEVAEREARRLSPAALARRLADCLSVAGSGAAAPLDRADVLLAPEVAGVLLGEMERLLVGAAARRVLEQLPTTGGRLASRVLTLIDDGRLPGGLREAPADGEGVPTRRVVLIQRGEFLQPLLSWRDSGEGLRSGCCMRSSWRDPPLVSPTHLYVEPNPRQSVPYLLGLMSRGYYFIDTTSRPVVDPERLGFEVGVRGFSVGRGSATHPIGSAVISGSFPGLMRRIQAVGRDLRFLAGRSVIGSPSLLVSGLEIRPR